MTKREQIMQALKALLETVPGIDGRVFRSREDALSREEAPAIVLYWDDEQTLQGVHAFTDKKLRVNVHVYQRSAQPDSAADPYVQAAHAAVMQNSSLGGLAIDVEEGDTGLELDQADATACFVNMQFFVHYRHQRDNLSV